MGHPVLRQTSKPVAPAQIATPAFQQLVDDLIETMREYDGAGLAAPQVHIPQRVVVFEIHDHPRYPEAGDVPLTVLVNPEINSLSDARDDFWEGCLSIPDLRGPVSRYTHIRLEALDRHGRAAQWEFRGFHAAVVQHECDHLDGVLYIDRLVDTRRLSFQREFQHYHWEKRT
jgi:peptide deformylase